MKFTVNVPISIHVEVEADNADAVTAEMVEEAIVEDHGQFVTLRAADLGDGFEIIGQEEG